MACPACGQENPPGAKFCNACGTGLQLACPACGHLNGPGSRFCSQCGKPLASVSSLAPSVKFSSPQGYTPGHLAEKILSSRSALEGERKQVTVLFADLKASMELIADRDPEEARQLLDPVLALMMEAVHRYEGIVNQVMGDGIMAIFGAPLAHEDHAVRACYAALAMQASIGRHSEEVLHSHGVAPQIRIGLNSGEVLVRAIDADLHMDYTAVGQTSHLAARMEQLAVPGSIWLTPDTLRLAEGFVQVRPVGPVPVKGLPEPIEVFELMGAVPTRTRFQALGTRGLTRFVGRQTEMDALHQALDRAASGRGQLVALVGEPGVGKSRLFWEFTQSHRTHGWLILESGSVSHGKAAPYLPITDLLRAYFQIEPRDDGRKISEKITGKLLTLDRALEPALSAFFALLDAPVEAPQWQALDSQQRRQQILDAVKRLLLRESQVQPLLLVFEDLHWIDSETQAFLDGLVEYLSSARILLLVNYRPEYQHGWGNKTSYVQLRIEPLPAENAEELLQGLLGDDEALRPLKRLLTDRTEGNPFFLEESVRTLIETKVLAGDRGAYKLVKPLPGITVPATVQAVLAARIDRLPAEEKNLLQTASVIGKDVPVRLLQGVADLPEDALNRALAHLHDAEFLYQTSLFPDLECTFKHALTHEVAYGSLIQARRRTLHARILEAIETLYADRLADQAERLAHHALRGEVWDKALVFLRQAAEKALARSAHQEAATLFEQALAVVQQLSQSHETTRQALEIRVRLRTPLLALGDPERMLDNLRQAENLAQTLGDQRQLARIYGSMAYVFGSVGDPVGAIEVGERGLAIGATLGDLAAQVNANITLGRAYYALGDYPRTMDCVRNNVAVLAGDRIYERFGIPSGALASLSSRVWLILCYAERGEFAEGFACGEEAARIAETVDRPHDLVWASYGIGRLHLVKGDLAKAIAILERCLPLCQIGELPVYFPRVASSLGLAYALAGRVSEGQPLLEEAVARAESLKFMFGHSLVLAHLSEGYLLAGRVDDALSIGGRALDLSLEHTSRGNQAWVHRLLGEIASHQAPPRVEDAESHFAEAIFLAGELGMRPILAHCHGGLGGIYRQMGDRPKADEHMAIAIRLFREMDMRYWLERSESGLGKVV